MTAPVRDAGIRLRRLLAVLAVLARTGRATVTDLAQHFDMQPAELVADLELAACCGLPPYTPDQLMEIVVDGDEVVARLEPALARPRRLSPAEGLVLAAAARAILAVPGADPDGALRRAVDKLDAVLVGRDGLRIELDEPVHLATVRRAVADGQQLVLRYHSASADEVTERVVDPLSVHHVDGAWYLDAWCHRAGGTRRFRVDRVLEATPTGTTVAPGTHPVPDPGPWVPSPDATVARLVVPATGAWLLDAVPVQRATARADGGWEIELAVSSPAWLGRLLVRLGPGARVLAPADLAGVGAAAARRILHRYRQGSHPQHG